MIRPMLGIVLACLALLALAPVAHAADQIACEDANGQPWTVSPQHPCAFTMVPGSTTTGTMNQTTVTCGVASTTLLAAGAASQFIAVKNPAGGGTVWINWAGAAAVAAPPSEDLAGGAKIVWAPAQGFVPTAQVNCIATVAQAVTLEWK